jgi:hypothetical protein
MNPAVAVIHRVLYREGWSCPAAQRREVDLPAPTSPKGSIPCSGLSRRTVVLTVRSSDWRRPWEQALVDDFHPFRLVLMIEAAVNGDGPILGDPSPDRFAKVILDVGLRRPDQFDMIGEQGEKRLAGAGMGPLTTLLFRAPPGSKYKTDNLRCF